MTISIDDRSSIRRLSHKGSSIAIANEVIPPPVHFESFRTNEEHLKSIKNKKIRKFYEVKAYIIYCLYLYLLSCIS